jgi:beta-xylosidase
VVPQTSDEFETPSLGLQWQWNANPSTRWWSLTAHPGALRLYAQPASAEAANLWPVPNLLFQKFPAPSFDVTTRLSVSALGRGESTGLLVMGSDYALVAVTRSEAGLAIEHRLCLGARGGERETIAPLVAIATEAVTLKVSVGAGAICRFAYSTDGRSFATVGKPFTARPGQWIGARVGMFASGPPGGRSGGYVDAEWFRIQ